MSIQIGPLRKGNATVNIEIMRGGNPVQFQFWPYEDDLPPGMAAEIRAYLEFVDNNNPPQIIHVVQDQTDPNMLPFNPDEPLGAPGDNRVLAFYENTGQPGQLTRILIPCQCCHNNLGPPALIAQCRNARAGVGYNYR